MDWFSYLDSGDVNNAQNYTLTGVPNCPDPNNRLCAIKANRQILNGQIRPVITGELQSEIATAISSKSESPNVLLKP